MADNVTLNQGSGGALVATDEVVVGGTTVHVQRVKPGFGADGSFTDASSTNPFPVTATLTTSATTSTITAKLATDAIMNDTTALTPTFAPISASSGDTQLVALVALKKIRVLSVVIVCTGAQTVRFESTAGGTALTGVMSMAANGVLVLPFNPVGWFETIAGAPLSLETTGTATGCLTYVTV